MSSLYRLILIAFFFFPSVFISGQCNSLNDLLGSFEIAPDQDTCIEINLERLMNNDLATNNSLQGVTLDFEHNNVSDLLIELTSPNGDQVTLVGDITSGSPTNGSRWVVLFSECGGSVLPDPGISSDNWENSEAWTVSTNFSGIYYPHLGCFEDFNVGPLNGMWKLRIVNTSPFETTFINRVEFSLENSLCIQCGAEAGTQDISNITICDNDNLALDLGLNGQTTNSDYALAYFVVDENDNVANVNLDGNFIGIAPGNYTICAFSVLNEELTEVINLTLTYSEIVNGLADGSLPYCLDIANSCTSIILNESAPIRVIDETICAGEQYIVGTDTFATEGTFSGFLPVQGADLCDTSVVLNLDIIDILPLIQSSAAEIDCENPSIILDGSTSIQETGSTWLWTTNDGQIDTDPTQISISISSPGTYFLQQTENSCTRETSFTISVASSVPGATISSDNLSCVNESVELTINSAFTFVSASWFGPDGFTSNQLEPVVSVPGEYMVVLTAADGCSVSFSYQLDQGSDQPVISADAGTLSCVNSSIVISVDNTNYNQYRWTGPGNFVSNVAEPTVTSTGTYFLEVQDENGCKGFTSVEVVGDEGTFDYEITGEDFKCTGGRVVISASSEASNAIYSWTGPNGYFSSSATNQVTEEGTYNVEIIANGCVVRDSITLTRDISELPEYEVQVENIGTCASPLWRLTAVPLANEFQTSRVRWGIIGVGIIAEGGQLDVSEVGRYYLRINTFNGCGLTYRFTIEAPSEAPQVELTARTDVNCTTDLNGGALSVTEDARYSYFWLGPDNFTADTSYIDSLFAGNYSVTVTDMLSGCVTFMEARVEIDTIPRRLSFTSTNIDCNDAEARVIASVNGGGNSYEWTGPEGTITSRNLAVTTPGIYTLTVTGGNGCITIDSLEVIEDLDPPEFMLFDTVLRCATSSAVLNAHIIEAGVTYFWEGPSDFMSTSAMPVVFGTGDYMVTLTGINGCEATGSILVSDNPDAPLALASSPDTLNCINTEVMILAQGNGVNSSFSWNGPASFISDEQNTVVSRPGEYVLSVESNEGCISFDTIQVVREIILPEVVFAFDENVDCIDDTATLMGISDDPDATFTWEGPLGFMAEGDNVIARDTGEYIIYVRGGNNCVDSDTFSIGVENIDFSTSNTISCFQPSILISEFSDSLNFNITWALPDGSISSNTAIQPDEAGTYLGEAIGSNGCLANVSVEVTMDTISPIASVSQQGEIRCDENEIQLNNNNSSTGPNFHYFWSTANGVITSDVTNDEIDITGVGDYQLTVIDSTNGCVTSTLFPVQEAPQEFTAIDFSSQNPRCFGENNALIQFNQGIGGTAPYTYSLDGIIFLSDSLIGGLSPGVYNYMVKDSFGCIVEEMIEIQETEQLELDLGENVDVFLGNEVEISATTNLTMEQIESIRWQIENQLGCADCLSFTLTPSEDLEIELTIADEKGCTVTDQIRVRVDENPVLYKPNVFSPNEDGVNDRFTISANPGVAMFRSIDIFDRWGTKVFERRNFAPGDDVEGWDGTIGGQKALPGVYVYKLEVEMITGKVRTVLGDITILR